MPNEIVKTTYRQLQVLNIKAGFPFKFQDALADGNTLQVTVKKTSKRDYKFFVRYDYGSDTYSTRFGYLDKQTYDFHVTEWSHGLYNDQLLTSLECDWDDRNTNEYHNIADEYKSDES